MIPSSLTSCRGFVQRKIRGSTEACRLLVTSTGQRISGGGVCTPSLLSVARGVLALAFPFLILLAALAFALGAHPLVASAAALAKAPLIAGPVLAKDGRAAEFRVKAEELRTKLTDPAVVMTKDEVDKAVEGIRTYEARAAAVAGFTPDEEIERQGGDEELKRVSPESNLTDVRTDVNEMDQLAIEVRKRFGGVAGYLKTLARSTKDAGVFDGAQKKLHERIQDFQKRTAILGEGGATDGGGEFLLPLQQVASIFAVVGQQFGIANIARRYPVVGRTLRIPYLIQDSTKANADGSGSDTVTRPMASIAAVDIIGEGDEKPEREPRFGQRLLTIYKLAAYTEMGDETMADDFTGSLVPVTTQTIGAAIMDRINEYTTTDGSGSSEPLAALHASNGAIKIVNRETSQSITANDAFNMYAAHTFGNGQSVWLINRTALPKLMGLTLGNNTLVTWLPSLTSAPQMALLGLPVYMTDLTAPLGVKGDLALVNGGFYALAVRQALAVESSIHYKFRNDLTAYRFVTRFGGIPIPTSTYAYKATGATKIAEHSPFVVLGDDVTS